MASTSSTPSIGSSSGGATSSSNTAVSGLGPGRTPDDVCSSERRWSSTPGKERHSMRSHHAEYRVPPFEYISAGDTYTVAADVGMAYAVMGYIVMALYSYGLPIARPR